MMTMSVDKLLRQKAKTCKQRKLANIRVKNTLNKMYTNQKLRGDILHFEVVGVKIKNFIQSAVVKIVPRVTPKDIKITIGFNR